MTKPKDLIAVDVHTEDVGDYNVTEPGWYAVDDGGKVVLGPFIEPGRMRPRDRRSQADERGRNRSASFSPDAACRDRGTPAACRCAA